MNAPLSRTSFSALPETQFAVPGMRCAGCMSKIETGLPKALGIVAARVNFTAKRVSITHLPSLTIPEIQDAINALGFDAHPITPESHEQAQSDKASSALLKAMAVAGFAMMNIMLLSVSVWSGAYGATKDLFHWLSAMIAIPTVIYSGRVFFASAWQALRVGRTNMDVPISIGVILATALSLYETFMGGQHAYFDGAVMLLFFLLTGRWLDAVMRDRARDGVTVLLKNRAAGGTIINPNGTSAWIKTEDMRVGMVMLVAAGERLAGDGIIRKGQTHVDLSLLTGEATPAFVGLGERIHAGTLNLDAPVEVEITAVGTQTALSEMARLMEDAGQSKSLYVRIADRAARYYAPAVHCLALASFVGWMIAGAGLYQSLLIGVAVLIITCPCALGLAVPAAQIVTAGALMKKGVLIKDGSALERLAQVDRALFDKTGTLTLGRPEVTNLADLPQTYRPAALAIARASRHPLAQALRRALEAQGVIGAALDDIQEEAGQGMRALSGTTRITLQRPQALTENLAAQFGYGENFQVVLHFSDKVRDGATEMVTSLKGLGIDASIISGDRASAVAPVAKTLGLTAQTSMKPQDKLDAIARLTAQGHKILMVGDGLNDGPALAAGYASLAPASASDVGQNAADAVFMGDSLAPISTIIKAARKTRTIVQQNFALAIGYNVIAVPLAICGYVTPLVAALAMSGSSLIVVVNAMRLAKVKP